MFHYNADDEMLAPTAAAFVENCFVRALGRL